jgi:calcineurin-like phosphoesterase family protein
MSNTFFTSDLHIGHKNCIALDKRPFTDLEHMHRVLVNNYNSSVKPGDVCYFLGDVGLCAKNILKDVISQMNGTKVLVCGNHDKGANAMKTAGFDVVLYGASLVIANELVTMSHCPLIGVFREDVTDMKGSAPGELWHGETRHSRYYSTVDRGQYHLHGHIHSPNGGKSVKILDKQYDVGVVANNYRPVSISDIESWISLHKQGKV